MPLQRRRILRLTPLDDLLAAVHGRLAPVAPVRMPLGEALGFVLAEPLVATEPVPAVARACRDGWAVAADDVQGAGPGSPVHLATRPQAVEAGEAMPEATDAVLPPDCVEEIGGFVEVTGPVARGEGVHEPGFDVDGDRVIRAAGQILTAAAAAAALAAGLREATVRAPWIRILCTGDHVDPLHGTGEYLADLARACGARLVAPEQLSDDPAEIAEAVADAAVDLVLTVAGTGAGTTDRTLDGIAAAGEILAHGIAVAPGETSGLGWADAPVLALPGRLPSAAAAFVLIGRPILDRLTGASPASPETGLPLAAKVVSTLGMTELVFLRIADGRLVPLGGPDLPLARFAEAEAYLVVGPELEGFQAGSVVPFRSLPALGSCR